MSDCYPWTSVSLWYVIGALERTVWCDKMLLRHEVTGYLVPFLSLV